MNAEEQAKAREFAKTAKNPLVAKLAIILGEIGKVPKSGHNSFHNYDYVTENDLVWAVRDKLAQAGIFVFSSIEEQEVQIISDGPAENPKRSVLTTIKTKHTFVDGDSGETFSVYGAGQGSDVGDKGGYKASTGAMKYFLYKCFMIPTGDDPEADERVDQRAAAPHSKPQDGAPTNRPAPSVPRETPGDDLRAKVANGAWTKVVIHFGKNKGLALGKLEKASIDWYADEWQPKPFVNDQGVNKGISPADLLMRAALDEYLSTKEAR